MVVFNSVRAEVGGLYTRVYVSGANDCVSTVDGSHSLLPVETKETAIRTVTGISILADSKSRYPSWLRGNTRAIITVQNKWFGPELNR